MSMRVVNMMNACCIYLPVRFPFFVMCESCLWLFHPPFGSTALVYNRPPVFVLAPFQKRVYFVLLVVVA